MDIKSWKLTFDEYSNSNHRVVVTFTPSQFLQSSYASYLSFPITYDCNQFAVIGLKLNFDAFYDLIGAIVDLIFLGNLLL